MQLISWKLTLVLTALSFIVGLGLGNAGQIDRFFTYSCKGYRFLGPPSDYEKQALIAVYQIQPRSDLEVLASETIAPSDPDMFAPSMFVDVGINEKSVLTANNGHQTISRNIADVIKVRVDGCGGIRFLG